MKPEDVKIPTQAEMEKSLPQPPKEVPAWENTAGMVVLLLAVLCFAGYVGHLLGWWGGPPLP